MNNKKIQLPILISQILMFFIFNCAYGGTTPEKYLEEYIGAYLNNDYTKIVFLDTIIFKNIKEKISKAPKFIQEEELKKEVAKEIDELKKCENQKLHPSKYKTLAACEN